MALGGARPGAGRKKKETVEEQATRRDIVLAAFTPERLKVIVEHDIVAAEAGHTDRIDRWLPYVLGSPKQEIAVGGSKEPIKVLIERVASRERTDG